MIRHDGLHFRTVWRQRAAVHAARHARIHPVLDGDFGAEVRALYCGNSSNSPKIGSSRKSLLRAGLEMTVAAGEIVAGKPFGRIRHLRSNMSVGGGDQVAPVRHQAAMIVIGRVPTSGTVQTEGETVCARRRGHRGHRDDDGCNRTHRPEAEEIQGGLG